MSKFVFGQIAKIEDAFQEEDGSSSKGAVLRRRIDNGDNFFWILPAAAGSKSSIPWSYFTAHYEPYSICMRKRPTAGFEHGALSVIKRGHFNECPRCLANWERYGWKKPSNSAEWRLTPKYNQWKRDNPRERVMIPVVPVDFLIETRKSRTGREEFVWVDGADKIFERFTKEYLEFLETPAWTERDPKTYPGFEFTFEGADGKDKTVVTGIQTIEWSAHEFIVKSNLHFTLVEDYLEAGKPFDIDATKDGHVIPVVMHVNRVSGKQVHETKYRASVTEVKGDAPLIPMDLLENINPILPDTFAITEPPTEEEMLETMSRQSFDDDVEVDPADAFASSAPAQPVAQKQGAGFGSILDGPEDDEINLSGFDDE